METNNGGMMISRGKLNNLRDKSVLVPPCLLRGHQVLKLSVHVENSASIAWATSRNSHGFLGRRKRVRATVQYLCHCCSEAADNGPELHVRPRAMFSLTELLYAVNVNQLVWARKSGTSPWATGVLYSSVAWRVTSYTRLCHFNKHFTRIIIIKSTAE
jgi:hypothetical protein